MASIVHNLAPFGTFIPSVTATSTSKPGIGAATWSLLLGSAISLAKSSTAIELSLMSTDLAWPFNSKYTVL